MATNFLNKLDPKRFPNMSGQSDVVGRKLGIGVEPGQTP